MSEHSVNLSEEAHESLMADVQPLQTSLPEPHPPERELFAYGDGTLTGALRRRLERHLPFCPRCAHTVEAFLTAADEWEGPSGSERLKALQARLRLVVRNVAHSKVAGARQDLIDFAAVEAPAAGEGARILPLPDPTTQRRLELEKELHTLLLAAGAIERNSDYVLPCGLHSDTHVNVGKLCSSERLIEVVVSVLERALEGLSFDLVVSTGWPMATFARRLLVRRRAKQQRMARHVMVEGYELPSMLDDVLPGSRAILLLDVVVTGGLAFKVLQDLKSHKVSVVQALALVDGGMPRKPPDVPFRALSRIAMDLERQHECRRCGVLPTMEFNPVAYRMTKKKSDPRSPSTFLVEDPLAREFWEVVDAAHAYEHHRIIGRRHYLGFVDTAQLLTHPTTGAFVVDRLCRRVVDRSGIPDVVLVPARARSVLLGRLLVERFERLGSRMVPLEVARQRAGCLTTTGTLKHRRVLVADVAAGHGATLDYLALLASDQGAVSVTCAVLLSRLSEPCEEAIDARVVGGFVRLYSLPVRPITVQGRERWHCPVCRRGKELAKALAELPAGPAKELATQLVRRPGAYRRRGKERAVANRIARQVALFPLVKCRRGVASGITLHALHAAMGDGMAPLRLPEISDSTIPSSNRAAMIEDLPASAVVWSGEPLRRDLLQYLNTGTDREVWMATVELLTQAGSVAWLDSLEDAIVRINRSNWMNEQFWAWMVYSVYRVIKGDPGVGPDVRARLRPLVNSYDDTLAQRGLRGMLAAASS